MTYKKNDARLSTLADGTTLTIANSAFPDAFSAYIASNGATNVMETTPKTYIFSGPDTGVGRADWTINSTHAVVEAMFDFTSIATSPDNRILTLFNTGQNAGFGVNLFTGKLRILDFAGGNLFTTTQTVYGKRVRVYFGAEIGASTNDGEIHFKAFFDTDADSATQGSASTGALYDSSVANTGTVNFTMIRVGKLGSGNAVTVPVSYVHSDDTIYTALGPLSANTAPIASAGPDQFNVEPWTTVTLNGTASTDDVGITAWSWTKLSGAAGTITNATTSTATVMAPATIAGDTSVFRLTVTDAGGLTGTDDITVTTLPVTERAAIGGVEVPMQIVEV